MFPPTLPYSGLTIILDRPSRHDDLPNNKIITGYAGDYFNKCLFPLLRQSACIYVSSNDNIIPNTLPSNTKVVLLLGAESFHKYHPLATRNHIPLNFMSYRGSPYKDPNTGIIYIATLAPQDAYDLKDYSGIGRDSSDGPEEEASGETESDETETATAVKDYSKTRRPNFRFWMREDIKKAVKYITSPRLFEQPEYEVIPYADPDELELLSRGAWKSGKKLFIDIETNEHRQLTAIGIGEFNSKRILVFPIHAIRGELFYGPLRTAKILRLLGILFYRNTIIGHNISGFDLVVLSLYYHIPLPKLIEDTMHMHHRCFPMVEMSLGHCISLYTDYVYHKDEGIYVPHNHQQLEQLQVYNGHDVARTIEVYKGIQLRLLEQGALDSAIQANKSCRAYLTATLTGARVDTDKLCSLFDSYNKKSEQCSRILKLITGRSLNPRSPKQVAEFLYNGHGFKKPPKDESPTNKKQLYKLILTNPIPSLRVILACKLYSKMASDLKFTLYAQPNRIDLEGIKGSQQQDNSGILQGVSVIQNNSQENICAEQSIACGTTTPRTNPQNRFTTSWKISGTIFFRLGSSGLFKFKNFKGFGGNFQNWSKKRRHLIISDPGKILIQVDQSGADALILAYLVRSGRYRALFKQGIKPHVYVAFRIFQRQWEELLDTSLEEYATAEVDQLKSLPRWKELVKIIKASDDNKGGKRYYFLGKKTGHAANYGMRGPTFRMSILEETEGEVVLTNQEATEFLDSYTLKLFPEINQWHAEIQEELKYQPARILRNLFGYPCQFYGMLTDMVFRKAYAFKPASTVATITNKAFTQAQENIELAGSGELWDGVDLLQNGHDSILAQAPVDKAEAVGKELQNLMKAKLKSPRDGSEFQMGSSLAFGMNWGSFDSVSNPNGMKESE